MSSSPASEAGASFRYDAYVSCADADRDWVEEHLAPRLEEAGRRVCLEYDLPPGGIEIEERSRAVAASRKTLVVVSEAYLESRWGLLEEAVTAELDPASRKRRLIPLLRDGAVLPLRIRPLVAVDLRQGGSPRHWQRLIDAIDPTRAEEANSLVQRWSLLLQEATGDLPRPSWHGVGAAWLGVVYLAAVAAAALLYLLFWDIPALRNSVTMIATATAHVAGALVWREDRDLFRRLSHLLARSRSGRAGVVCTTAAVALAWGAIGVPAATLLYCGPWGCKERGKIHLVIDAFDADGSSDSSWARGLHQDLALKLQAIPQVEVLGIDLPSIDAAARRRLEVDYSVVGRFDPSQVTASVWNQQHRPVPPAVTVASPPASDLSGRLAVQNELTQALLQRMGVEVEPAAANLMARLPTHVPRAAELNDEGFRLLREGQYEDAFTKLREALELDDNYSVAWSNLAEVAWRVGRYDQALEYRRAAIDRLPTYAPFHYNLGHLLAFVGQDEGALVSLRQAVELDRAHVSAYNELGNVLLRLGEPKRAAEELRKGLLLEPDFAPLAKNLGRALLAQGDLTAATAHLEDALAAYPKSDTLGRSEASSLLVQTLARRRDATAACRYLAELRALDPDGIGSFSPAAEEAAKDLPCAGPQLEEEVHV